MRSSVQHVFASAIIGLALAANCAPAISQQATPSAIPAESFFKLPQFEGARFSPDGKSIAMLLKGKNDRIALAVLEVGKLQPEIIANYEDKDVKSFHWVNNERLVYDLTDHQFKEVQRFFGPGLYGVNKDRTKRTRLVTHKFSGKYMVVSGSALPWYTFFLDVTHDNTSPDVFVAQAAEAGSDHYLLYRLNTITGNTEPVMAPGKVTKWLIDKSGTPRVVQTIDGPTLSILYNDPKTNAWRTLTSSEWSKHDTIDPVFFSPEGDLYVTARNGKDMRDLYRFDLEKNKLDPAPVIALKGYDFNGHFSFSAAQKKVLGLDYEMSTPASVWFDPAITEKQKKLDALLPYTVNHMAFPDSGSTQIALVHSTSDVDPGIWQLFDFDSGKFTRLGISQPDINPALMSPKEMVHFTTRDDMTIPAYLTLPKSGNGKNLPMVVLVHGGPYLRGGHWSWNPQVQFLASRGYAVLEPEFRGSTGYGQKLFAAGMKQWGLGMQDDIADATKWAISKGYADPQRICIAGASYGGYATLMGLIKNPELYRCGIDWVGVTDINLLYDHWSDLPDEWKWYGMPALIGDQQKDAAQLKATSPLENADKLKLPLLMAYGKKDHRVPIEHGYKFYDAVKANNPDVEWLEYAEEGHGFKLLKNNVDFWNHVEKFLAKHTAPK